MADNPLKYKDLLEPDNSITQAIEQLGQLNKAYSDTMKTIRDEASRLQTSLKGLSGSTEQHRTAIDGVVEQVEKLARAYEALSKAQATVQAATEAINEARQREARSASEAATASAAAATAVRNEAKSYDELEAGIDTAIGSRSDNIKRMVEEEAAIKDINAQLTKLRKLQEQSGGSKYSAKIEELTNDLLTHKAALAEVRQEVNNSVKLDNAAATSMNALSQQLSRMRIAYRALTEEERKSAFGQDLLATIQKLDKEMKSLDASIGNHQRNVGNYASAFDGLNTSVQGLVRELPSLANGAGSFLTAIANNVQQLVRQFNKLREANVQAAAAGQQTVPVWKTFTKSLLSWNTAISVGITLLAVYSDDIVNWISKLVKGRKTVLSTTEAMEKVNKALENTSGSFGQNMVLLRRLQQEWGNLKSEAEKTKWIEDNQSEFSQLGISINNVHEAENALVDNTDAVISSLQKKAMATAALTLASQQYEEALKIQQKINTNNQKRNEEIEKNRQMYGNSPYLIDVLVNIDKKYNEENKTLEETQQTVFDTAAAFIKLSNAEDEAGKAFLEAAGIKVDDGKNNKTANGNGGSSEEPKDLTKIISDNGLKIRKQYEKSVTALVQDEYAKRSKQAEDSVTAENAALRRKQDLNEEYIANVEGIYKQLTSDQIKEIEEQQELIQKTIDNNIKAQDIQLQKIKNEQKVATLQVQRNNISTTDTSSVDTAVRNRESVVTTNMVVTRDTSQMEASLIRERELMAESLDQEYALILESNRELLEAGDSYARSEEDILAELNKKKLELFAEYDRQILEARQRDVEAQLAVVKKGSEDELKLLLELNELRRQIALAGNAAKPASEQQDTSVINAQYDKSAKQTEGDFLINQQAEQQALDAQLFNEVEHTTEEITKFQLEQEKAMWEEKIRLAKDGALDWSDAQIEAAESAVKGIDNKLEKLGSFADKLDKYGLGGALLSALGLKDEQVNAVLNGIDTIMDSISDMYDALIELAEAEVEAQQERVDAAQSAYDAEVEARNNGYANNVATAKKELEQEQKKLAEKEQMLEEYEQAQERIDTLTQISSLVTAVANIWKAFSGQGWVGAAMAAAMTAAMFTAFAAAKIKARQAAGATSSSEYGSGGLEFLEGGSHASGHDIDLGVNNSKGKRMRAEGGEALAIISKRRTRKYRRDLPEIIGSLNNGTFEEKFMRLPVKTGADSSRYDGGVSYGTLAAWGTDYGTGLLMRMVGDFMGMPAGAGRGSGIAEIPSADSVRPVLPSSGRISVNVSAPQPAGLGRLEGEVRKIREQNETRYYTLPDGRTVIQRRNVKRIIKN